jgi:hypothetical protein
MREMCRFHLTAGIMSYTALHITPCVKGGTHPFNVTLSSYAATDTEQRETRYRAHDSNEPPQCHRCTRSCAQR